MTVSKAQTGVKVSWPSQVGQIYVVYGKSKLTDATWTPLSANISATGSTCSWNDTSSGASRFYCIMTP